MTDRPESAGRGALRRWMNDDGEPHPLENGLALLTLALGLGAVLSLLPGWWDVAAVAGFLGALVAVYDEFISKTFGERRVIAAGFVLCLVAIAVAMAHGAILGA